MSMMKVSSNPHVRSKESTSSIMILVVVALLHAIGFGIYNFGIMAAVHVLITIAACVLTEFVFNLIIKKKQTVSDLSAVVTGMLLGLNLPVGAPWWIGILGGFFAILVVKCLFGGLGENFMNPALGARCFLVISFPAIITNFNCDAYSGATPLALLKNGQEVNILDMVIGRTGGTIGETSVIAIVIGACILLATGVIDLRIPGSYIVSFVIFVVIFGGYGFNPAYIAAQLSGGGLMLGAFFMATDYVTSPMSTPGALIYGFGIGLIGMMIRYFGSYPEGMSFAILLMNMAVPLLDRAFHSKKYGR